jgi:cyanophycinase-like exopeptidase
LGIGIDEKAAIVVSGERFEVIGEGRVAIHDNARHDNRWYYFLTPGTFFDLKLRRAGRAHWQVTRLPKPTREARPPGEARPRFTVCRSCLPS